MPEDHFFNVKDFGAKGDGVTDDTAAIEAALAAAAAQGGGTIYLDAGTYIKKARPSRMRTWLDRTLTRLLTKLIHINWKHGEHWTAD